MSDAEPAGSKGDGGAEVDAAATNDASSSPSLDKVMEVANFVASPEDAIDKELAKPSDLARQASKNKKSAIKRGHINAAWNSVVDLKFWLKDLHRWSKIKLESINTVASERIKLKPLGPRSGEIPSLKLKEPADVAQVRDDARRYIRQRIHQLLEEEKERLLTPQQLVSRLYQAAGQGDVEQMKLCIARGAPVNDRAPECGDTALHYATYWGRLRAVEVLLGVDGIDLFAKDEAGDTALEIARHFGHARICQLLCKRMGVKATKADFREEKKKYPGPWHAGALVTPGGKNKFKGVTINLTDARREVLRRYWEALEAKRPRGVRGTPSTLEQLQLTAFAERVKDWFDKLEEGERAFVHQLKMKSVAKWPKHEVRLDLM